MANILLIDDDDDLSHFLQRELQGDGHKVQCLDRAERGPDLLAGGAFDVVLLDNKMPGMSGIEFLGALRQRGLEVPVILMTGHDPMDTAIQAMDLGAFDYVAKPMELQALFHELQPKIEEALKITRPVTEVRLQTETSTGGESGSLMVGKSKAMVEVYKLIGRFARSADQVLIQGETGTGKELVARAIHTNSPRKAKPFVALNCTALNETLLDDELFGHEPGAFTGGERLRKGKFEYANGGTLFLDELGDMPMALQLKLLRVVEDKEVVRIGGNDGHKVDVRVLSATSRDLQAGIQAGSFRQDLFYRINRVTIRLPPLRERLDDLLELATYFLRRATEGTGRTLRLTEESLERLRSYSWPGNVRQLQNVLHRAAGVCRGPQILPSHLDLGTESAAPAAAAGAGSDHAADGLRRAIQWAWDSNQPGLWPLLRDMLEHELLKFALEKLGDKTQVAKRLEMARTTVIERVKKYKLP